MVYYLDKMLLCSTFAHLKKKKALIYFRILLTPSSVRTFGKLRRHGGGKAKEAGKGARLEWWVDDRSQSQGLISEVASRTAKAGTVCGRGVLCREQEQVGSALGVHLGQRQIGRVDKRHSRDIAG